MPVARLYAYLCFCFLGHRHARKRQGCSTCSMSYITCRPHKSFTGTSQAQGVIVAAPVYAATGSRWKAMGIAVASVRPLRGFRCVICMRAAARLP